MPNWNCRNSDAVVFELRCSGFELFCSESGGKPPAGSGPFRPSDCGASETREARLRARAETGQTWQPSHSRPTLPTACEVVDSTAGQDCDEGQFICLVNTAYSGRLLRCRN